MKIKIGVPSKGRLRKDVLKIFRKNKYNLISERGERDYFAKIKNKANIEIIYLHAREIIERLGDNSLDVGFSGYDLLKEALVNIQKKISVFKKYNFGNAKLVVAIPNKWIDVQTIADLEEVAFEFKDSKKQRLRVATKYPNLTRDFLFSKGVTQFKLVNSLGATETYPFTGSSEIITDITSTGKTLKANDLRVLKDGIILESQACLLISKISKKKATRSGLLNSLV
jgi:ATP phosphoribosyltransferase